MSKVWFITAAAGVMLASFQLLAQGKERPMEHGFSEERAQYAALSDVRGLKDRRAPKKIVSH